MLNYSSTDTDPSTGRSTSTGATNWKAYGSSTNNYMPSTSFFQYEDEEEDALCYLADLRKWRKHLKSMWVEILNAKSIVNMRYVCGIEYYRKALLPISGWVAKTGHRKKRV